MSDAPPSNLNRYERIAWWCAHRLERTAEFNATGLAAVSQYYFVEHPTKPCTCEHGTRIEEGQLRTCEACRGLGNVPMTKQEIRDEYRAIRARVCEARAITPASFDEEAGASVQGSEPGYWLDAARRIEAKQLRERAARKQEARNRW